MTRWVLLCGEGECSEGQVAEVATDSGLFAVAKLDGQYFVLDGFCPHQGGPLGQGTMCESVVTCPWHRFQFDMKTGVHVSSGQPMQTSYQVKVEQGQIFVAVPPGD